MFPFSFRQRRQLAWMGKRRGSLAGVLVSFMETNTRFGSGFCCGTVAFWVAEKVVCGWVSRAGCSAGAAGRILLHLPNPLQLQCSCFQSFSSQKGSA